MDTCHLGVHAGVRRDAVRRVDVLDLGADTDRTNAAAILLLLPGLKEILIQ